MPDRTMTFRDKEQESMNRAAVLYQYQLANVLQQMNADRDIRVASVLAPIITPNGVLPPSEDQVLTCKLAASIADTIDIAVLKDILLPMISENTMCQVVAERRGKFSTLANLILTEKVLHEVFDTFLEMRERAMVKIDMYYSQIQATATSMGIMEEDLKGPGSAFSSATDSEVGRAQRAAHADADRTGKERKHTEHRQPPTFTLIQNAERERLGAPAIRELPKADEASEDEEDTGEAEK